MGDVPLLEWRNGRPIKPRVLKHWGVAGSPDTKTAVRQERDGVHMAYQYFLECVQWNANLSKSSGIRAG